MIEEQLFRGKYGYIVYRLYLGEDGEETNYIFIDKVFIYKEKRNKGYGYNMVRDFIKAHENKGITYIELEIPEDAGQGEWSEKHILDKFYKSLGFENYAASFYIYEY